MAKNTKGIEVRAYQILNHAGKMKGKKVFQKKIDAITACEIVERGNGKFAFRIVEAQINNGTILATEVAKAASGMTLDMCIEQIASYKKFHAAPTAAKTTLGDDEQPGEQYTAVAEVWLKDTQDRGADEIYDELYKMCLAATEKDGQIVMTIPPGFRFESAEVPEKDYCFVD